MAIGSKGLVAVISTEAVVIILAATLLLRGSWQTSAVTMVGLFLSNVLAMMYLSKGQALRAPTGGLRKTWYLGIALVAAAAIRLSVCIWEGFSPAAIGGSVTGFLVGAMFIYIAVRGGRAAPPSQG